MLITITKVYVWQKIQKVSLSFKQQRQMTQNFTIKWATESSDEMNMCILIKDSLIWFYTIGELTLDGPIKGYVGRP